VGAVPRIPLIYSGRVRHALQLAEQAHRGTNRKAGDHPYLLHPIAVAQVLIAAGADDDLICAAYLHDVVEDTAIGLLRVEDEFGQRVARLVAAVTKPRAAADGRELTSAERDELTLEAMRSAPLDAAALKAADLVANLTDLILDEQHDGYGHWDALFREKAERKLGHYLALADVLVERLSEDREERALLGEHLRQRTEQFRAMHSEWLRSRAAARDAGT
jgi:(p)ppGpp synthase/HD superfamily hydrolase